MYYHQDMRRFVAAVAAFCFLAFVGTQAAHRHAKAQQDDCRVCALGSQASRVAPTAAPAPLPVLASQVLSQNAAEPFAFVAVQAPPSRGPPAA